jgi:hypothetical protein
MAKTKPSTVMIRVSVVASVLMLVAAAGAAAFVAGYTMAFSKTVDLQSETALLKARAIELEAELLHLRNYAVLIDAVTTNGKASRRLQDIPYPSVSEIESCSQPAQNEDSQRQSSQ